MKESGYTLPGVLIAGIALGAAGTSLFYPGTEPELGPTFASAESGKTKSPASVAAVVAAENKDCRESRVVFIPEPSATKTTRDDDEYLDPRAALVEDPPAHVMYAAFYGPDVSGDEAEQMRQEALDELTETMRAEGFPEEDIDAMLAAASGVSEEDDAVPDDPMAVAPTVDEEVDDLVSSMESSDLPEEDIVAMVDALYDAEEADELLEEEMLQEPNPDLELSE